MIDRRVVAVLMLIIVMLWPLAARSDDPSVKAAEQQIQKYLDTVRQREQDMEQRLDLSSGKAGATQTEAFKKYGAPAWVIKEYAGSWSSWIWSDYRSGGDSVYRYHAAALASSLSNVQSAGTAAPEDLKRLATGMAEWDKYEQQFRAMVLENIELNGRNAKVIADRSEQSQRKCSNEACEQAKARVLAEFDKQSAALNAKYDANKQKIRNADKHFFVAIDYLTVALTIDDSVLDAQRAKLRDGLLAVQSAADAKARELDRSRELITKVGEQLQQNTADVAAAYKKLASGERGIEFFYAEERKKQLDTITKAIAVIEDWFAKHPRETVGKLTSVDDWNFNVAALTEAKKRRAELEAGWVELSKVPKPGSPFEVETKRLFDAIAEIKRLGPQRASLLEQLHQQNDKAARLVTEIDAGRAQVVKQREELLAKTPPPVRQVDVVVANTTVLRSVYSPDDDARKEVLAELNARIAEEQKQFVRALENKNHARDAFFAESKAAVAAGDKLGGMTGLIMLNALADAASNVGDVVAASRKGGLYGALAETLKKASEFAIAYVASDGKDVGYAGVDEKAIEEKVRQGAPGILNTLPLTLDELKQKEPQAVDWAKKFGVEKLEDKAKKCGPEKAIDAAYKKVVVDKLKNIRGKDAALEAQRKIYRGYIKEMNEPGTIDKLKALRETGGFRKLVKDNAAAMTVAGLKLAGKKYEESVWKQYFEHDLTARVLFEVYKGYNELYLKEADRYEELIKMREELLDQCPSRIAGSYRVQLQRPFRAEAEDRPLVVAVTTGNVESTALKVQIAGKPAGSSASSRFEGAVAAGSPSGHRVPVTISAGPR